MNSLIVINHHMKATLSISMNRKQATPEWLVEYFLVSLSVTLALRLTRIPIKTIIIVIYLFLLRSTVE